MPESERYTPKVVCHIILSTGRLVVASWYENSGKLAAGFDYARRVDGATITQEERLEAERKAVEAFEVATGEQVATAPAVRKSGVSIETLEQFLDEEDTVQ